MDGQNLTVEDLKPQVLDDWVAALRSGEYRQGTRHLYHDGSYCVLGVLCDVVDPGGWSKDDDLCVRTHTGESSLPSESVVRKSFSHYASSWRAAKLFGDLSGRNDGTSGNFRDGYPGAICFEELADYLEGKA